MWTRSAQWAARSTMALAVQVGAARWVRAVQQKRGGRHPRAGRFGALGDPGVQADDAHSRAVEADRQGLQRASEGDTRTRIPGWLGGARRKDTRAWVPGSQEPPQSRVCRRKPCRKAVRWWAGACGAWRTAPARSTSWGGTSAARLLTVAGLDTRGRPVNQQHPCVGTRYISQGVPPDGAQQRDQRQAGVGVQARRAARSLGHRQRAAQRVGRIASRPNTSRRRVPTRVRGSRCKPDLCPATARWYAGARQRDERAEEAGPTPVRGRSQYHEKTAPRDHGMTFVGSEHVSPSGSRANDQRKQPRSLPY